MKHTLLFSLCIATILDIDAVDHQDLDDDSLYQPRASVHSPQMHSYLQPTVMTNSWMHESGVMDKCQDGEQVNGLLRLLKDYPLDRLEVATTWMKTSIVWDSCKHGGQVRDVLSFLKSYPLDRLLAVTTWIKISEVLDKDSMKEKIPLPSDILKNYYLLNGDADSSLLAAFYAEVPKINAFIAQDKSHEGTQTKRQICILSLEGLLSTLEYYRLDHLETITTWMKTSGVWDKCNDVGQVECVLRSLKDYPLDEFESMTTWMETSGALGLCQDGRQIGDMLLTLEDYPLDHLEEVAIWMKTSGGWGQA